MEANFYLIDTLWFAVDRDGHVACFDHCFDHVPGLRSGGTGAVPVEAFTGDEAYRGRDRLARILPRCQAVHDLRGRLLPGATHQEHLGESLWDGPVLMFLASLDPVRHEVAAGRAVEVPASEGVAVVWRRLVREGYERLHAAGACRGCFFYFDGGEEGMPPNLAQHGLFDYRHLTVNWFISGPYGRAEVPVQPVHVDQLPPDLRRQVKQMRFETLRFAETPHIQPVEHGECASWEAGYLDVTGRDIRPIPGKEEEYADHYEELAEDADPFRVEPPRNRPPEGE
jgi:hypothetical protein